MFCLCYSCSSQLREWAAELGFIWRGVSWREFSEAVKNRCPSSPAYHLLPFLERYGKIYLVLLFSQVSYLLFCDSPAAEYWFDPWPEDDAVALKQTNVPVSITHLTNDLPSASWPNPHDVFKLGFIYLCQKRIFSPETLAVDMTLEQHLAAAKTMSGLCDMGPFGDFILDGYRRIFESFKSTKLTFNAKVSVSRTITQYLANLMYMADMAKRNSAIQSQEITSPVFIVGLNRSGTSLLHHLMSQDPETRTTSLCEMIAPYGGNGKYKPVGIPTDAGWEDVSQP